MLGLKHSEADQVIGFRVPAILRSLHGRRIIHRERSRWRSDLKGGDSRNSASCGTLFRGQVTVELAEQGIPILFGPISKVDNKVFDLLARGFAQDFDSAKINGVGLHQVRIELMLANQLAKSVADLPAAVVSISRSGGKLANLLLSLLWLR